MFEKMSFSKMDSEGVTLLVSLPLDHDDVFGEYAKAAVLKTHIADASAFADIVRSEPIETLSGNSGQNFGSTDEAEAVRGRVADMIEEASRSGASMQRKYASPQEEIILMSAASVIFLNQDDAVSGAGTITSDNYVEVTNTDVNELPFVGTVPFMSEGYIYIPYLHGNPQQ